jgi:hypothetical protein
VADAASSAAQQSARVAASLAMVLTGALTCVLQQEENISESHNFDCRPVSTPDVYSHSSACQHNGLVASRLQHLQQNRRQGSKNFVSTSRIKQAGELQHA